MYTSSMSMMNIAREIYQEASEHFKTLIRGSKTTQALLNNLKEFQTGCKDFLKNRELTISSIPVEGYLEDISQRNVENLEGCIVALQCLLRFALNLCRDPGKEEFHVIKRYTANYKCNIESSFSFAADLLVLIGYQQNNEMEEFLLDRIPEHIHEITFDLFLTTIEFGRVLEFVKEAQKEGFTMSDCLQARKEINQVSGWTSTAALKCLRDRSALEKKTVQTRDVASSRYREGRSGSDGDAYFRGDNPTNRDSSTKFAADVQEYVKVSKNEVDRNYSVMDDKDKFYTADRRASDNNYHVTSDANYHVTSDAYKGSIFLEGGNDINDHDLYGDSRRSFGSDVDARSYSSNNSSSHSTATSTDLKGSYDIYNSGQYGRTSDKQFIISDDRSRSTDSLEKVNATNYQSDIPKREIISESDSRTSGLLSSKDTSVSAKVPDRLSGRSSSISVQRVRSSVPSETISEQHSSSSVLYNDKTKEFGSPYEGSKVDISQSKTVYRTYDQAQSKKTERTIAAYTVSNESTLYGHNLSEQRYVQAEGLPEVSRESTLYRSQTRSKPTEICARGAYDYSKVKVPSLYNQ